MLNPKNIFSEIKRQQPTKLAILQEFAHQSAKFADLIESEGEDIDVNKVSKFNQAVDHFITFKPEEYLRNLIDKTNNQRDLDHITEIIQTLVASFFRILATMHLRAIELSTKALETKKQLEAILENQFQQIKKIFIRFRLGGPYYSFSPFSKAYKILENIFKHLRLQQILPQEKFSSEPIYKSLPLRIIELRNFFLTHQNFKEATKNVSSYSF